MGNNNHEFIFKCMWFSIFSISLFLFLTLVAAPAHAQSDGSRSLNHKGVPDKIWQHINDHGTLPSDVRYRILEDRSMIPIPLPSPSSKSASVPEKSALPHPLPGPSKGMQWVTVGNDAFLIEKNSGKVIFIGHPMSSGSVHKRFLKRRSARRGDLAGNGSCP